MKTTKIVILGLLVVLLIGGTALGVINLVEQELHPEVISAISQKPKIPQKMESAFTYLLGIRADENVDPMVAGQDIRQQIKEFNEHLGPQKRKFKQYKNLEVEAPRIRCIHTYCPKNKVDEVAAEIKKSLSKNHFISERFKKLISMGGYGTALRPNITLFAPLISYYEWTRLQNLKWSFMAYEGQIKNILNELEDLNRFSQHSLQYPNTLLESSIHINVLKANREFISGLVNDYPEVEEHLTPELLQSFVLQNNFDELADQFVSVEILALKNGVDRASLAKFFSSSNYFPSVLVRLLYNHNATLNLYHGKISEVLNSQCVRSDAPCPSHYTHYELKWNDYFYNPIGKSMIQLAGINVATAAKRLYKNVSELQRPLAIHAKKDSP